MMRYLRSVRPENETRDLLTWETQPIEKREALIAKWVEILGIIGQASLTPETLAREEAAWEVRRIARHTPDMAPTATWEAHSPAWQAKQLAKWTQILTDLTGGPKTGVFNEH
jgi:hypothetical protein